MTAKFWEKFKHKTFCDDRIIMINANCEAVMAEIGDKEVDLVLTDPPYRNQEENQPTKDMRSNGSMQNFGNKPSKKILDEIFRISKGQIIWGANNFDNLPSYKGFLIWDKGIPFNFTMSSVEMAYISDNISTIAKMFYCLARQQQDRIHPTQKPTQLMSWCLTNYSKEDDLIFDAFAGSFTTAIACIRTKRRFIGVELDPVYFEKAVERVDTELKQLTLF